LAEGGRPVLAFGLGIVAVVSISVSGIIAKHQSHHYGVLEITGIQSALAFVWLTVVTLFVEGTPAVPTTWAMVLLGYLVLMGSVVPFLLFYWLLRHVSTTRASLIGYLVPFVALVTGIVLIDERLEAGIAIGGLLILAGVMWTDRAERKVVPRRAVVPH
jgi:drug/metabolite transporter (DMT)-like permease